MGAAGFRQLSIPVDAKKRFRSQDKVVKMHGRKITANKLGNVQQRKNFQTQPSPFKKKYKFKFLHFLFFRDPAKTKFDLEKPTSSMSKLTNHSDLEGLHEFSF